MISIQKKDFLPVMERVNRIAVQKSPIPHVGHVKIVFGKVLQYSVTDLSTSLIGTLDAFGGPESFTVNAEALANAVKNVLGDTVKLSLDKNGRLKVSGDGKREFKISTLPVEEFPSISYDSAVPTVSVSGASLRTAVSRVQFALASHKDARSGTDCIKLTVSDGILTTIATNGHCLARYADAVEADGKILAVIPRGAVPSILALTTETVGIYTTPNEIGFKTDNEVLIVRAVAKEYPAVENAINAYSPKKSAMVIAESVLGSLAAIRGSDSAKNVDIAFTGTEMTIEGGSEDIDRYAMDSVSAAGDSSKPITVAADYLTGALKGFSNASIAFEDTESPVVTISDSVFLVIILPITR